MYSRNQRGCKKSNSIYGICFALIIVVIFLLMPSYTFEGAYEGIQLCMNIAVPSLFPMMFATVLIVETGLADKIAVRMAKFTKLLFGLPGEAASAILLAVTGGFPAGAKAVCGMYERGNISKKIARYMMLFCFGAGPAFLIGTVGNLYGDPAVGFVLFVFQIISVVILGCAMKLFINKSENVCSDFNKTDKNLNFATAMTASAKQAASAMLNICIFIIIFNIFKSILDNTGISSEMANVLIFLGADEMIAEAILPVILEVTSGCISSSRAGLPVTAFAVGFGGLAVHMQILAIAEKIELKYSVFFLARILQGVICAVLSCLYLRVFPGKVIETALFSNPTINLSTPPAGAVMLILMSVMCVFCLSEEKVSES